MNLLLITRVCVVGIHCHVSSSAYDTILFKFCSYIPSKKSTIDSGANFFGELGMSIVIF